MKHRIKCRWIKWKEASGILYDKRIPMILEGKFYKSVVRQTMLYRSKCRVVDKKIEQRMSVAKMRMLSWMNGVTRGDGNEHVREIIGIASIVDKIRENRFRCFGHVVRRENLESVRNVIEMNVKERRERGRLKKWLDEIGCDMKTTGVCVDDVGDRVKWRFRTQVVDLK